jgi:hypothetical protein
MRLWLPQESEFGLLRVIAHAGRYITDGLPPRSEAHRALQTAALLDKRVYQVGSIACR